MLIEALRAKPRRTGDQRILSGRQSHERKMAVSAGGYVLRKLAVVYRHHSDVRTRDGLPGDGVHRDSSNAITCRSFGGYRIRRRLRGHCQREREDAGETRDQLVPSPVWMRSSATCARWFADSVT